MRLKSDLFGTVTRVARPGTDDAWVVERDARSARWWSRPLAHHLMTREARALRALAPLAGVPKLEQSARGRLVRTWIDGKPMHLARPGDPTYFSEALKPCAGLRGVAQTTCQNRTGWSLKAGRL
jgi:hypothetical protein